MDPSTSVWVVDTNPSIAPGLPALIGERARVGSTIYFKVGPLDTDWSLSPGGPGVPSAPSNATYITQTPDATLTNEQALSALVSGVMQVTTATGVVDSFAVGTGLVPYGASSKLATTSTFGFNSGNVTLSVGVAPASANSASRLHLVGTGFANARALLESTGSGVSDYAEMGIVNDLGMSSRASIYYTSSNYTGVETFPNSLTFSTAGGAASHIVFSPNNTMVLNLLAASVAMPLLAAGGVVYATAATGVLKIGTSAEVAAAITWPATNHVLVSSGTTTAPIGDAIFQYLPTPNLLVIGEDGAQSWNNLGEGDDATYERVRAYWSSNVFVLGTETSGGTERDMTIGNGTTAVVAVTSGGGAYLVGGAIASAPTVVAGNTSIALAPIGITVASAAGATLDAVRVTAQTVSITGSTNITTATGFNYVTINRPTFNGTGGAKSITNAATVYIQNAPTFSGDISAITNAYALWIDAGLSRFDGNGTNVFELPADATANATGTVGRIPVLIGGTTRYLRYYAD